MEENNRQEYRTREEIETFFRDNGLVYLKRTQVEWKLLFSKKLDQSPYYLENRSAFETLSKRYGPSIDQCAMAH